MNIRRHIRFGFVTLLVISLLLANTSSVAAGGGKGGESGEISVSVTYPPQGVDASKSLPGGGYATATASIIYNSISVKGKATTSISGTTQGYSICAQTQYVFKDGIPKGGTAMPCVGTTGGGSIYVQKTVYESPYGHFWQVYTYHQVSNANFGWFPYLYVSGSL